MKPTAVKTRRTFSGTAKMLVTVTILTLGLVFTAANVFASEVRVLYNRSVVSFTQPPKLHNGYVFYPLEDVLKAFAGDYNWDAATSTISAELNGNTVGVSLIDLKYIVNGKELNVADEFLPFVESDLTYVYLDYIVEGFGLDVSWNEATQSLSVSNNRPSTPEVSGESAAPASTTDIQLVKITVDGAVNEFIEWIHVFEATGDDGVTRLYVAADELLAAIQPQKDIPYTGKLFKDINTYAVTTKAPFTEGKPLREVMDKTGSQYDVKFGDGIIVEMTLGTSKATVTIGSDPTIAKVESSGKTAEFMYYISAGTTFIVEESFLQALKDIGYMQ